MWRNLLTWLGVVGLLAAPAAWAQLASPNDLSSVYKAFKPGQAATEPMTGTADDGYLRFIMAPADSAIDAGAQAKSTDPVERARQFLHQHKAAFGMKTSGVDFTLDRLTRGAGRDNVRMNQTFNGIPVFGAQVNVGFDANGDVRNVLSDVMREATTVDTNALTPGISSAAAQERAIESVRAKVGNRDSLVASPPEIVILDPSVLGTAGETRLAHRTEVADSNDFTVHENVFTDAQTGNLLLSYTLNCTALSRRIYDMQNSANLRSLPGVQVRSEGQAPIVIEEANLAYDLLGDTYDFYFNEHGRDGLDNKGGELRASVRFNEVNAFYIPPGFFFDFGNHMVFGVGLTTDDITAHELTHGVTEFESQLIYAFESGAINEALSDIWGEFVDLTNGRGLDTADVRWLQGEESILGAIRDMRDPTVFGDPDRYSQRQILPEQFDNGGVHINSGIANKLAYLLTDGDVFNGYFINGMGISRVADLFYRAQTEYLMEASDFADLFFALALSASDLGWSEAELDNLFDAATAVEIAPLPSGRPLRHLRATTTDASANVTLTWKNPSASQFTGVTIVRKAGDFPAGPQDGTLVYSGVGTRFVDTNVNSGEEVFYTAFANFTGPFARQRDYARAVSGSPTPDYLSEAFFNGTDLSFSQILYSPVGDWSPAYETSVPSQYINHDSYTASYTPNVFELPVKRLNALTIDLLEDEPVVLPKTLFKKPFPFFGRLMDNVLLSPNGFISPNENEVLAVLQGDFLSNLPSYQSHFEIPRISFLFSDLSPPSAGDVWFRSMNDRLVITFEYVPEFNRFPRPDSTVQVELFYSGHIRVTYLAVNATTAVAGLSDGNGIPLDPASQNPVQLTSDLTGFAPGAALTLDPIPVQTVLEGERVLFTARANPADGGSATLSGSNLPFGATFDPLTGQFEWNTSEGDEGVYNVVIQASQGAAVARQDVLIIVNDASVQPTANEVAIVPEEPVAGEAINVVYTYDHDGDDPEGISDIYWYRNGYFVSALTNLIRVPANVLVAGDRWYVVIVPRTVFGLAGEPSFSEEIVVAPQTDPDVNGDTKVDAVDIQMVINAVLGKDVGRYSGDVNRDGTKDAADVQSVTNKALK